LREGVGIADDGAVEPFGAYLLIDALDAGGMGEVWLAAPRGLSVADEVCVLKRVKSALAADDLSVTRFLDEARLGLMLRHPCIARTIDAGRVGGADYLAAELVEGIDLAKLLQRLSTRGSVVEPGVALWCVAAALDGLAAAHAAAHPLTGAPLGVVHRDVSPHNLMATRDGLVRVIDFGLAVSSVREAHTEQGVIVGKLGYLAPEQATSTRATDIDGRCDVFAAGIVLYELLTTERYWQGVERHEIPVRVALGTYRPRRLAEVDARTGGLVSAMTATSPANRPTAAQARDVLLAVLHAHGGVGPAQRTLAELITTVAGAELARFDAAKATARQTPSTVEVNASMATICLAISERRAVAALLKAQAPAVTREVSAARIGPEAAFLPSASLVAMAAAHPQGPTVPMAKAPAATPSQPATTSLPTSSPLASPEPAPASTPRPASRGAVGAIGAVLGAAVVGLIAVALNSSGDAPPSAPPPSTSAVTAGPAPSPSLPPTPPPATAPPPSTPPTATTEPPVAAPPPRTGDPLLTRLRRLARCEHACGRTFERLLAQSPDGVPADKRKAVERMAINCEQHCR